MKDGILYRDLYFEKTNLFKIVIEPRGVEEVASSFESGLALREITKDFNNLFTYTTENIPLFLKERTDLLFKGEAYDYFKSSLKAELERKYEPFLIEKYYSFLKALERNLDLTSEIKHYRIGIAEKISKVLFFNSEEESRETSRRYIKIFALVVAERDGRLERGYETKGYTLSLEEALNLNPEIQLITQRASQLAKLMLSAKKVKAGVMPVVLAGCAGGTMIHEAVGHGLEADHAEAGLSVYSHKLGEKVASPLITVIDDPTIPHLYGSYVIDDEGVPAERIVLIDRGILKNYLYDRFTAYKYKRKVNGHGRRESFRYIPIPRMSNTFISPGKNKVKEIINSINFGILVKKMGGGEVNPLTGDFVFEVVEGYLIEKGEIVHPIKGATLVGNGPKVLESIDMVAEDLHFEAGLW